MDCLCDWQSNAFEVWPDDVEQFVAKYTLHEDQRGIRLYHCEACGQWWLIDIESRSNIAVKLTSPAARSQIDLNVIREQIRTEQSGGLGDEICRWRECNDRVVSGTSLCSRHLFRRDWPDG